MEGWLTIWLTKHLDGSVNEIKRVSKKMRHFFLEKPGLLAGFRPWASMDGAGWWGAAQAQQVTVGHFLTFGTKVMKFNMCKGVSQSIWSTNWHNLEFFGVPVGLKNEVLRWGVDPWAPHGLGRFGWTFCSAPDGWEDLPAEHANWPPALISCALVLNGGFGCRCHDTLWSPSGSWVQKHPSSAVLRWFKGAKMSHTPWTCACSDGPTAIFVNLGELFLDRRNQTLL